VILFDSELQSVTIRSMKEWQQIISRQTWRLSWSMTLKKNTDQWFSDFFRRRQAPMS
jgi:hypothetical protein